MELKKVRKLDGAVIEYYDEQATPLIAIRETKKVYQTEEEYEVHKNDFGFIRGLLKSYGKRIQIDNAGLDSESGINNICNLSSTRVVFIRNNKGGYDYAAFYWLDQPDEHKILGYNHVTSIHGLIRSFRVDEFMNRIYTSEFYKKMIKLKVLDKIVSEIFESQSDIISINADLPEFLKARPVKAKIENTVKTDKEDKTCRPPRQFKDLPAHKLLTKAGFKCPYQPIRGFYLKNNRPCDLFVYQIHRKFWERNKKRTV